MHGELADSGTFDDVAYRIIGAHLGGNLGFDLLGIGAPITDLYEGILGLEGRGERTQRLIDDHRRVIGELALLFGAFDQPVGAIRAGIGQDICVGRLRRRRCRQQTSQQAGPPPHARQALLRWLAMSAPTATFGVTPQPIASV